MATNTENSHHDPRQTAVRSRDAGLVRLRRLTRLVAATAAALTGVFAAIAAGYGSGKATHRTAQATTDARTAVATPTRVPGPGSLYPVQAAPSSVQDSAAAVQQALTQSFSQPVVTSGGS